MGRKRQEQVTGKTYEQRVKEASPSLLHAVTPYIKRRWANNNRDSRNVRR